MAFDPRTTPARPDVAAAFLRGQVSAGRFADGRVMQVVQGVVDLRAAPQAKSGLQTQLLFGELFTVYDENEGWAWGQAAADHYVGYARLEGLVSATDTPTHRVVVRATPLLSGPDVKSSTRTLLPMNAKIHAVETDGRFVRLDNNGFVFAGHLEVCDTHAPDWVAVAERFDGVPYLWGGKTAAGLDCSGLAQTALEAGGIAAPRDTDMMQSALGSPLPLTALGALRRGDLIFWKGHMGIMRDAERLLHANAHTMDVTTEPLAQAVVRIAATAGPVTAIKRLAETGAA